MKKKNEKGLRLDVSANPSGLGLTSVKCHRGGRALSHPRHAYSSGTILLVVSQRRESAMKSNPPRLSGIHSISRVTLER